MRLSRNLLFLKGKEVLHPGSRYLCTHLNTTILFYSTNSVLNCNCEVLPTFIVNYSRSKQVVVTTKKYKVFLSLLSKTATFQFSSADLRQNTRKTEYVNFLIL
jgi:hypothetical protein